MTEQDFGFDDLHDADEAVFIRIFEPMRTTLYNTACERVYELQRQIEALPEKDDALIEQLEQAKEARIAVQRAELAMGDEALSRMRANEWRVNEGRKAYNASRRRTRDTANADLSKMTPDQKKRHEADLASDRQFRRSRRVAGWDDQQIDEALGERRARRALEQIAGQPLPPAHVWGDHCLYPKEWFSYD